MYHVYGYYKHNEACLLFESQSEDNAIDWAKSFTFRDLNGYYRIHVQYDREISEGITETVILWSIYGEPMSWSDNAKEEF
jgi:hypothetical protein